MTGCGSADAVGSVGVGAAPASIGALCGAGAAWAGAVCWGKGVPQFSQYAMPGRFWAPHCGQVTIAGFLLLLLLRQAELARAAGELLRRRRIGDLAGVAGVRQRQLHRLNRLLNKALIGADALQALLQVI